VYFYISLVADSGRTAGSRSRSARFSERTNKQQSVLLQKSLANQSLSFSPQHHHTITPQHYDTLVTGATGFIGSVLVRQLVEAGRSVRIVRRPTSRLDLLEHEGVAGDVDHATGTLDDARSLRRAMEGVRHVYHTAGLVGPGRRAGREELRRVNTRGTANVVNAALEAGVERLAFTSSIAALGPPAPENDDARGPLVDETASWSRAARAPSPYAQSKRDAEREVHRGLAEGLPSAVIVNPALVFGRGRPGEGTRRLVDAARRGRLWVAPPGTTCVADVEDVAAGHRRALRLGETGRRYLLGGDTLSWRAVFGTLAEAFGHAPPRLTLPPALLRAAGAASEALAFVTRSAPLFSRQNARALSARRRYTNRRARNELGCRFRSFEATAQRLASVL
jgi:dihydroflavonol-4-reductase